MPARARRRKKSSHILPLPTNPLFEELTLTINAAEAQLELAHDLIGRAFWELQQAARAGGALRKDTSPTRPSTRPRSSRHRPV